METLFDLASKNTVQQISGDRLRIEKPKKRKLWLFCMTKETFAKCNCPLWILNLEKQWQRKRHRVEIENLKNNTSFFGKHQP